MSLDPKDVLIAAIFSAGEPIALERLQLLFDESEMPSSKQLKEWLEELTELYAKGPLELKKVASGYRFQVRSDYAPALARITSRKLQKYSRAIMETLALIIYKQPITRGEIEQIRGVAVSSQIIKTLQDRDWIKVVGHRDVPGKPALFATTKIFLDYFNLESLSDLPPLEEVIDLERVEQELNQQLAFNMDPKNEDLPVPENEAILAHCVAEDEGDELIDKVE
jgi:segregation and condensation protein B